MTTATPSSRDGFDGPAAYQIRVQGRLESRWSARLGGMTISVDTSEQGAPVTTLCGILVDQAALAGVLSQLYDLRYVVLSVQRTMLPDTAE